MFPHADKDLEIYAEVSESHLKHHYFALIYNLCQNGKPKGRGFITAEFYFENQDVDIGNLKVNLDDVQKSPIKYFGSDQCQ